MYATMRQEEAVMEAASWFAAVEGDEWKEEEGAGGQYVAIQQAASPLIGRRSEGRGGRRRGHVARGKRENGGGR